MLKVQHCSVTIGKKVILSDIDLQIEDHALTVLVGKNGVGKSTLIRCMNQQIPYEGEIKINEQDLKKMRPKERAKQISFLLQGLPSFHLLVKDLVAMGRNPYLDLTRRLQKEDEAKIEEAMGLIGIRDLSDRYLDELSGGERQKAYLAMILAQDTPILVLDEPTTQLDMPYEAEFLDCLVQLKQQKKKTILIIMHDLNQAIQIADRLIILSEGKVYFEGTKQDALNQEVLQQVFHVRKYTAEDRIFFTAQGS